MTTQTLLVMRHAKSDWSTNESDFDRPLNKRGLKDARRMGQWLKQQNIVPDRLVSSPALRTTETVKIVCKQLGINNEDIIWDDRIYEADLDDLLQVVAEHGKNANRLMLTGHNPGLDSLVNYLTSDEPQYTASGKLMTTAAIAAIDFRDGFNNKKGSGRMVMMARPKEI